jgi:hypothetical protein
MASQPASQPPVRVVARSSRREIILGVLVGVVLLAIVLYGVLNMGAKVTGKGLTGRITEKHFMPEEPSTEITIGKGGVSQRDVDGTYTFVLWVEAEKKYYTVWVDKSVYETRSIGEDYFFLRPGQR